MIMMKIMGYQTSVAAAQNIIKNIKEYRKNWRRLSPPTINLGNLVLRIPRKVVYMAGI